MQIKQIEKENKDEIDITEWNEEVRAYLKPFTAYDTLAFNDLMLTYYDREKKSIDERYNAAFDAVQIALVGEDGAPLLSETDRETVRGASFEPIVRTFNAVYKRNENKDFDTLKKN